MDTTIVIAATAAVLLASMGAADAKHNKRHYRMYHAPVAAYVPASPYAVYPNRPPWAAPWQCFTDEGYGRFRPCDASPSSGR
jgi:hypothetical protein